MDEKYEASNDSNIIKNEKRSKQVTVRLAPTLLAKIQEEADNKHISVAGFIQSLMIDYFDHKELGDECKQRKADKQKKKNRNETEFGRRSTDRLIQKILLSGLNVDNIEDLNLDSNNFTS